MSQNNTERTPWPLRSDWNLRVTVFGIWATFVVAVAGSLAITAWAIGIL